MRPDEVLARRLAAEIDDELASLRGLAAEHAAAPRGTDTFSLRARGSILHDVYTAVERIFVRIAEELNGGVPQGEQWHRQLLRDMTLELADIRPAVITEDLAADLGDYLRFRHLFRNVYGSVLEAERMRSLEAGLADVAGRFEAQVRAFGAWMAGAEPDEAGA